MKKLIILIILLIVLLSTAPAHADIEPTCVSMYGNAYCVFLPVVTCEGSNVCYPPDTEIHE